MKRGDVILVRFPHPSGIRGKKRPAVIVQSDAYSGKIRSLVVAEITGNLSMANDPCCLFIDSNSADGNATGIIKDCHVSRLLLVTVAADASSVIATLSPKMVPQLNACLKVALEIP